MDWILLLGYLFGIITGVVLGILGGGGSMMILPVFVYLFKIDPPVAVIYSLFVVGFSSFIGSIAHFRLGNVRYKIAFIFGIPSIISVIVTRKWLLPAIPDIIIDFSWFTLDKNTFLLSFFAFMMLFSAYFMLTDKNKHVKPNKSAKTGFGALAFEGAVVGFVTALVGAGGGFLIIPALLYFARLPIKIAIGTSLLIIAMNSIIGFASSVKMDTVEWKFIGLFTLITSIGMLLGTTLSKKINADKLKKAFAIFIVVLGTFMLVKEFWLK